MGTAEDFLDDKSQSAEDFLNEPDSRTGLSKLESFAAPAVQAGVRSIPGAGAVESVGKVLAGRFNPSGGPTVRRMVNETGGMMAGEAAAGPVGAGVGNVVGGTISDIEDHPEMASKAIQYLTASLQGNAGAQFIKDYQQDPEATTQTAQHELVKAGVRFTIGATAQVVNKVMMALLPQIGVGTLGKNAGMGMGMVGKQIIPGIQDAENPQWLKGELEERGYKPTLDQITDSRLARSIKSVVGNSDVITGLNEKNAANAYERMADTTKALAGGINGTFAPSDVADVLTKSQEFGQNLVRYIEKAKYDALDDLVNASETPIDLPPGEMTGYRPGGFSTTEKQSKFISSPRTIVPEIPEYRTNPATGEQEIISVRTGKPFQQPETVEKTEDVEQFHKTTNPIFRPGQVPEGTSTNIFTGKGNAPGVVVPTQPIKNAASSIDDISMPGRIKTIINNLNAKGRYISFSQAQAARTAIGALTEDKDPLIAGPAKKLYGAFSNTMGNSAYEAGKDVFNAWQDANRFTEANKKIFSKDIVAKVFTQEPMAAEKVGQRLMMNGNTTQVSQVMDAIDRVHELSTDPKYAESFQKTLADPSVSPEAKAYVQSVMDDGTGLRNDLLNKLKAGMIQHLQATNATPNPLNPDRPNYNYENMLETIDPKTKAGVENSKIMNMVFGPDGAKLVTDEVRYATISSAKTPTVFNRALYMAERILGGIAGAGVGGMFGHPWVGAMAGEVGGVVAVPKALSYLLVDPAGQDFMLNGLKTMAEGNTKTGTDLILKAATAVATKYSDRLSQ